MCGPPGVSFGSSSIQSSNAAREAAGRATRLECHADDAEPNANEMETDRVASARMHRLEFKVLLVFPASRSFSVGSNFRMELLAGSFACKGAAI